MGIISNETVAVKRLAERLILRCVEVERPYIAAFWLSNVAGYNAAVDAGLCVRSFSDRRLGVIFFYLCRCAELRIRPTIDGCLFVADRYEPGMIPACDYDWVYRLVLDTDTVGGRVGDYAERMRHLADIRQGRARVALAEYGRLAAGDEFTVLVTLKRNTHIRGSKYGRKKRIRIAV